MLLRFTHTQGPRNVKLITVMNDEELTAAMPIPGMYACMYVYVYVCTAAMPIPGMYACMYVYVYVCTAAMPIPGMCVYVCMYMCMYVQQLGMYACM